jgi:predicted deacetylase
MTVAGLQLGFSGDAYSTNGKITLIFRLDDYSATSNSAIENVVFEVFRANRATLLLGVIPFVPPYGGSEDMDEPLTRLPQRKLDELNQLVQDDTVVLALHGHSHLNYRPRFVGESSEFRGLPIEAQRAKISTAEEYLESHLGNPITIFVPPWNSYDSSTVVVLEERGFHLISGSAYSPVKQSTTIRYLPATTNLKEVRLAVDEARKATRADPVVVVLFHLYDFTEVEPRTGAVSIDYLKNEVEWASTQDDIEIADMVAIEHLEASLTPQRARAHKTFTRAYELLPRVLLPKDVLTPRVYVSQLFRQKALKALIGPILILYLGLFALTILITRQVSRKLGILVGFRLNVYLRWLMILTTIGVSVYTLRNLALGLRGAMAMTVCIAATLQLWIPYLIWRRTSRHQLLGRALDRQ